MVVVAITWKTNTNILILEQLASKEHYTCFLKKMTKMTKCQRSLGHKSTRPHASVLSSLLFFLSFAVNGYFNDNGRLVPVKVKRGEEVKGCDYLREGEWKRKYAESEARLTMRCLARGTCRLALRNRGRLENGSRCFQDERFIVRCYHQWWELKGLVYLTRADRVCIIEEPSHWK